MVLQTIKEKCLDFYDQIPREIIPKIAKSAIYTFVITFVFSKKVANEPYHLGRPLFAAGAAALASLIYAVTTPIFNMIFKDDRLLPHTEFLKQIVNITLCSAIFSYATHRKVNLLSLPLVGSVSINLIKSLFEIIPLAAENLFNDKEFAEELRELYKKWSIDCPDGTSSIFINFGIFPALGLRG